LKQHVRYCLRSVDIDHEPALVTALTVDMVAVAAAAVVVVIKMSQIKP